MLKHSSFIAKSRIFTAIVPCFFLLAIAAPFIQAAGNAGAARTRKTASIRKRIVRRYSGLPLAFEKNEGQFASGIEFEARGDGYNIFLKSDGVVIWPGTRERAIGVGKGASRPLSSAGSRPFLGITDPKQVAAAGMRRAGSIRLTFAGANRRAAVAGLDELPGKSNYFVGRDPLTWRTNVPLYSKVEYANVYPGINLIFYGNRRRMEFDMEVAPGSAAREIRLRVEARGSKISLGEDGDLIIHEGESEVRLARPLAYQDEPSEARGVNLPWNRATRPKARPTPRFLDTGFVLLPDHEVTFKVGGYDPSKPLVIDPVLDYSTYFGGTGFDEATGIAVDAAGNAYITGYTTSADLPTASPLQSSYGGGTCNNDMSPSPCFDAFVAKLNPQGTALLYATYLGGSGDDRGTAIAVDASGEAFVTGYTGSSDFPTANAFQSTIGGGTCGSSANPYPCYDAFVARLSASGSSLVYSSYLGGGGDDYGSGIAVDSSLNAYVTGFTSGGNFPVTSGAMQPVFGGGPYDAFVTKIGASGSSLAYSTFLGGSGEDRAAAIAVDSAGDAYVTGQTDSTNFPLRNAFQAAYAGGPCGCFDAFVAELNPAGSSVLYSTYLGGTGGDYGNAIAVDSSGEAFVAGWTTSTDFPVSSAAYQKSYGGSDDAFVTRLSAGGDSLIYSTYLGGIDPEAANGIALDSSGDALVVGNAYGVGFPAVDPLQAAGAGYYDAFVAALNPSGSAVVYATWLGGSGDDYGNAIATDASGSVYLAGATFSTDFSTTPGSLAPAYAGGAYDAFVAKILPGDAPGLSVTPDPVTFAEREVGAPSSPQTVKLTNSGSAELSLSSFSVSGDFSASSDCPASIPGGKSCSLSLTFTPTATGSRQGALIIADNATGSPQSVPLAGTGTSGTATLSAASLNFGSVEVGTTSAPESVALQNTDANPLLISSLQAIGDYSESNNCGNAVAAGASCTIEVSFSPTSTGTSVGQIEITDSAPASPQTISLAGSGTAPAAALSPSSLSFGTLEVGTTSSAQTATLTNSGSAPLAISAISASRDFAQTNDCSSSLAPGATCAIGVTYGPTTTGAETGALTVSDNAPGSPQTLGLSGSGVAAFSISASSRAVSIIRGTNQASFVISATSTTGFSSSISLSCAAGQGATCAFNPVSIDPGENSTLTVSNLSAMTGNSYSLTAAGVSGTESSSVSLQIEFADFSVSALPSSASISAGETASYQLTVSPVNGFNYPISLSCEGAPAAATCSFSASTVTPNGTSASTVAISVATTARGALPPASRRSHPPGLWPWQYLTAFTMCFGLWLALARGRPSGLRPGAVAKAILIPALLAICLTSCGGGGGSGPDPVPVMQGTPAGTYTITLNATTDSLSHPATVDLAVK